MMLARTTLFLALGLSLFLDGTAAQQLDGPMDVSFGAQKFRAFVEAHDRSVRARATGPTRPVQVPTFEEMLAANRDPECLLVRFRDVEPSVNSIVSLGLEPLKRLKLIPGLWSVRVPAEAFDIELLERINASPMVLYAEPDYRTELALVPNDPNISTAGSWWLNQIRAFDAWEIATDASAIGPIGIFDTGINPNHEDVAVNMWVNPGEIAGNNIDDDGNGYIDDVHGISPGITGICHGTPVSGTICGSGDNGVGYAGASWKAIVMDLETVGSFTSTAGDVAEGMDYALSFGVRISNHSWRMFTFSQVLADTTTQAEAAGHLMLCAAGNENDNVDIAPTFPATLPNDNVIAVAASTVNESKISYSSYGAVSVDLAAPTEYPVADCGADNAYGTFGGTSQATPTVCGAVALAWAQEPSLSFLEIRSRLLTSVRVSPLWAGLTVTEGILDMSEFLRVPDSDGDGILDEFDLDDDNDGVPDVSDDFPLDPTETTDTDGDGVGDNADADDDGDGVDDIDDFAPLDPGEQYDSDGDGLGNEADDDDDGDGVLDVDDDLPLDPTETVDSDGDGVGDNGDLYPNNPNEWADFDGDGLGDNADVDADNDGLVDDIDALRRIPVTAWSIGYPGLSATDNSISYDGSGVVGWTRGAHSGGVGELATMEHFELSFVLDAASATANWAFGLGVDEQGVGFEDIDWAFASSGGAGRIYNSGALVTTFTQFMPGDEFVIAYEDGTITWSRDGVQAASQFTGRGLEFYVDSSFSEGMTQLGSIVIRPLSSVPESNLDGDSFLNELDLDSDGDSITDANEIGVVDRDRNGIIDDLSGGQGTVSLARDSDGDGLPDFLDLESFNPENDGTDYDVVRGGYADLDTSRDGRINQADAFGGWDLNANGMDDLTEDFDRDGIPNETDPDDDNDGVPDDLDGLPFDASETQDSDGDGVGDVADAFPLDPNESSDFDLDGIGDNVDVDDDNDGVVNVTEAQTLSQISDWVVVSGLLVADDNSLTFPGGSSVGWFSQAVSKRASLYGMTGDYEFSWRVTSQPGAEFWIAGLGQFETDADYSDVDFGFYVATGGLYVLENGNFQGFYGPLATNDLLAVGLSAGQIVYRRNGQVVRSVPFGGNQDLYFDSAFSTGNVVLEDIRVGLPGLSAPVDEDQDGDGVLNARDLDSDGDTIPDCVEAGFADANFDGVLDNLALQGTVIDALDSDGDGLPDYLDLESMNALNDGTAFDLAGGIYASLDSNADGKIDAGDTLGGLDLNGNGLDDILEDPDGDGIPSELDSDDDGDGVPDSMDAFPFDPTETVDSDGDGVGDNGDLFPNDAGESLDTDGDGFGDNSDGDGDNDGLPDVLELLTAHDLDSDNDGILDVIEAGLADTDNDGFVDSLGLQGSVIVAPDSDFDGIADYLDLESTNALNDGTNFDLHAGVFAALDTNGDGRLDGADVGGGADADGDGIDDLIDRDPTRFGNMETDCDSDGTPDSQETDCNGNGVPDNCESFTDCNANSIPDECEPDCDGDGVPDACDPCAPLADFSLTPELGFYPLSVTFTDQSLHGPTSWTWFFGDGATSNLQNPTHVYTTPGVYSPRLTASSPDGSHTRVKLNGVRVLEPSPVAAFTSNIVSGSAPLYVQFTDSSTQQPTAYTWDFGDGATSTAANPLHRYELPGTYSVELTVANAGGTDAEFKADWILVGDFSPGFVDGSFELSTFGTEPAAPWWETSTGVNTNVRALPPLGDVYFPTEGDNWLAISAAGSAAATPPSNPLGLTAPSVGGATVSQEFHFDPAGDPILRFEAAFILNGNAGDAAQNDWMSVEVSDGVDTHSVYYADSFSDFVRFSPATVLYASVAELVRADLRVLFPTATLSTQLTLTIAVGNGGDGLLPSVGYVDNFHVAVENGAAVRILGCGGSPYGSLRATGVPAFGDTVTVELDNPLGTTCPSTTTVLLYLSNATLATYPCGVPLVTFGMGGLGSELFLSPGGSYFSSLLAPQWTGAGTPTRVSLSPPFSPGLVGASFYGQAVFIDVSDACGVQIGLTDGVELILGF